MLFNVSDSRDRETLLELIEAVRLFLAEAEVALRSDEALSRKDEPPRPRRPRLYAVPGGSS